MPRPDDLIGLLRSAGASMRALPPLPGHEARMRARLAAGGRGSDARKLARPVALAFCAVAAAAGVWTAWTAPEAPETSVRPLPAPAASESVSAEPRTAPFATEPARPPRWVPRTPIPALPIRRPHSENAPSRPLPSAAPALQESPSRASRAPSARDVKVVPAAPAPARDRSTPRSRTMGIHVGSTAPSGTPAGAPTSMGGFPSAPRPAAAPGHDSPPPATTDPQAPPSPASEPGGPEGPADACRWISVSSMGVCLPPDEIKLLAFETCDARGLALTDLVPALDCGGLGSTFVMLRCCGPDPSPPAQGPAPACKPVALGDGLTCVDAGSLNQAVEATCLSWGLPVSKIDAWGACGDGGATTVEGWCCPAAAPESDSGPPPAGALGDGQSCTPNDELEDAALSTCEALGLTLIDLVTADDCEGDASTMAKYLCGE